MVCGTRGQYLVPTNNRLFKKREKQPVVLLPLSLNNKGKKKGSKAL